MTTFTTTMTMSSSSCCSSSSSVPRRTSTTRARRRKLSPLSPVRGCIMSCYYFILILLLRCRSLAFAWLSSPTLLQIQESPLLLHHHHHHHHHHQSTRLLHSSSSLSFSSPFSNKKQSLQTTVCSSTTATRMMMMMQSSSTHDDNHNVYNDDDDDDVNETNKEEEEKLDLKLLLIDHYDSFTYNLVDILGQVCTTPPRVLAVDAASSWEELLDILHHDESLIEHFFDGIVLSPGPGNPTTTTDDTQHHYLQLSTSIIKQNPNLPILGVCLGHQIMACVYGAKCVKAPTPVHGQIQSIRLVENEKRVVDALFDGLSPSLLQVTRYHSLHVTDWDKNGTPLIPTAFLNNAKDDDILMAMRHDTLPHFGVQFHPESVGTTQGKQMLYNFCRVCNEHKKKKKKVMSDQQQPPLIVMKDEPALVAAADTTTTAQTTLSELLPAPKNHGKESKKQETDSSSSSSSSSPSFRIYMHKIDAADCDMLPLDVMEEFLNDLPYPKFWLDHAAPIESTATTKQQGAVVGTSTSSPMSLLGASPNRIEYWGREKAPEKQGLHQWTARTKAVSGAAAPEYEHSVDPSMDILTYLQQCHASTDSSNNDDAIQWVSFVGSDDGQVELAVETAATAGNNNDLPFQFRGGHVGYLGYEVRHDTAKLLAEQEHGKYQSSSPSLSDNSDSIKEQTAKDSKGWSNPLVPTAAFGWADRTYVYDHTKQDWYLAGVAGRPPSLLANDKSTAVSSSSPYDSNEGNDDDQAVLEWMQKQAATMRAWKKSEPMSTHGHEKRTVVTSGEPLLLNAQPASNGKHQLQIINGRIDGKQQPSSTNGKQQPEVNGISKTTPLNGKMEMPSLVKKTEVNGFAVSNGVNGDDNDNHDGLTLTPLRSRETYNRNFDTCLEQICLGESYELCLTNQLRATVKPKSQPRTGGNKKRSPLDLYRILRQRNPAPYSAFLDWNSQRFSEQEQGSRSDTDSAVAICCSSPERFVSVKRQEMGPGREHVLQVEAKPMKGTAPRVLPSSGDGGRTAEELAEDTARARALQTSTKDRAENLMIVDLLRNDLSRVCETGSVHVAKLMDIESFETVHQMVSTIRGTLDATKSSTVDVLKTCFPGGSMTGAPKLRTMELLEEMEEHVSRGPYSGCLGYISLNGALDMNIIIRTAVLTPSSDPHGDGSGNDDQWNVSIGSGGAITALSECNDEYDEMILKASRVAQSVQNWSNGDTSALQPTGSEKDDEPQRVPPPPKTVKKVLHVKDQLQRTQSRKLKKERMAPVPPMRK